MHVFVDCSFVGRFAFLFCVAKIHFCRVFLYVLDLQVRYIEKCIRSQLF